MISPYAIPTYWIFFCLDETKVNLIIINKTRRLTDLQLIIKVKGRQDEDFGQEAIFNHKSEN